MAAVSDEILTRIDEAAGLYHRLVLLVAGAGSGKTAVLREVAERTHHPRVNLNLELSRRLLDLTARQRSLQVARLCDDIVAAAQSDVVLIDNLEILFDPLLRQHPLHLLQALARHRTLVASWNGRITRSGGRPTLHYAAPDHPEYQSFPDVDALLVELPAPADALPAQG